MHPDDLVSQVVRQASEAAAQTGELTFDQLDALLPSAGIAPEVIEEVFSRLAGNGIRLVDDSDTSNPVARLLSELRRFTGEDRG